MGNYVSYYRDYISFYGDYISYYRNNQIQPGYSSLEVFMKGGACKEVFTAFQDCAKEAEKNNESIGIKCYPMLEKCMMAHSDYYHPILVAEKSAAEVLMKGFMPSTVVRNIMNGKEDIEVDEGEAERLFAIMEGGACKESLTAYVDCFDQATKNKEDTSAKCSHHMSKLVRCMYANPEHLQSILAAEEHMRKMFESL